MSIDDFCRWEDPDVLKDTREARLEIDRATGRAQAEALRASAEPFTDWVRDRLAAKGIDLNDLPSGTHIPIKVNPTGRAIREGATQRAREAAFARGPRIYLAGPMTGIPQFNYPAFDAAAADLRAQGFDVVSPAELDDDAARAAALASPDGDMDNWEGATAMSWGDLLARDVKLVADEVDRVVVLDGWERSRGARLEVFVARLGGKVVQSYPDLALVEERPSGGEVRIVNEATGGAKGTKPQRFELLPWAALGQVGEVYAFGAEKYEANNWRKGFDWSLSFGALQRHLAAFWEGQDNDPESRLPHLAHAAFHVLGLLTFAADERYAELDDRP